MNPTLPALRRPLATGGGEALAFNADIWQFALSVPGILAALLLLDIATLSICFEFAVVVSLARQAIQGGVSMKTAIVGGLWSFGNLRGPGVLLFALYALVLLPLANMGATSSLLPQLSIPNFITGELTKTPWAAGCCWRWWWCWRLSSSGPYWARFTAPPP